MPQTIESDLDSVLAQLETTGRKRPGPPCGVATILNELRNDSPERADRIAALIDAKKPGTNEYQVEATAIAEGLAAHFPDLDGYKVRRHRNRSTARGCKCPR